MGALQAPRGRRPRARGLVLATSVAVLAPSLGGCAAAFRPAKAKVHVESTPEGADVQVGKRKAPGPTPVDVDVDRNKAETIVVSKDGHAEKSVTPRRKINAGWLTADILTCVFPVALCIPVIVDAITGAWHDVEPIEPVALEPGAGPSSATKDVVVGEAEPLPAPALPPAAPSPDPALSMSEPERKAAARAAFAEGVDLQQKGQHAAAAARLETAQKLFPAPTHLVHLARSQAALGRLVDASETYETLARTKLAAGAPPAFVKAQEEGRAEAEKLRPRVPTLRLQIQPPPAQLKGLSVTINGQPVPSELVGLTRPVNPGKYSVTVRAEGFKPANVSADVAEGTAGIVDVRLAR